MVRGGEAHGERSCCQEFESTCSYMLHVVVCVRANPRRPGAGTIFHRCNHCASVLPREMCAMAVRCERQRGAVGWGLERGGRRADEAKENAFARPPCTLSPELCTLRAPLYRTPTCSHGSQDDKEDVGGGGGARSYPSVVCRGWFPSHRSPIKLQGAILPAWGSQSLPATLDPEPEFCQTHF
jgi:hypothetical protein